MAASEWRSIRGYWVNRGEVVARRLKKMGQHVAGSGLWNRFVALSSSTQSSRCFCDFYNLLLLQRNCLSKHVTHTSLSFHLNFIANHPSSTSPFPSSFLHVTHTSVGKITPASPPLILPQSLLSTCRDSLLSSPPCTSFTSEVCSSCRCNLMVGSTPLARVGIGH